MASLKNQNYCGLRESGCFVPGVGAGVQEATDPPRTPHASTLGIWLQPLPHGPKVMLAPSSLASMHLPQEGNLETDISSIPLFT